MIRAILAALAVLTILIPSAKADPTAEAFNNLADAIAKDEDVGGFDDGYAVDGVLLTAGGKVTLSPRTVRRTDRVWIGAGVSNDAGKVIVKAECAETSGEMAVFGDGDPSPMNKAMLSVGYKGNVQSIGNAVGQDGKPLVYKYTLENKGKEPVFVAFAILRNTPPVKVKPQLLKDGFKNLNKALSSGPQNVAPSMNVPIIHAILLAPGKSWRINPVSFVAKSTIWLASSSVASSVSMTLVPRAGNLAFEAESIKKPFVSIDAATGGALTVKNNGTSATFVFWMNAVQQ